MKFTLDDYMTQARDQLQQKLDSLRKQLDSLQVSWGTTTKKLKSACDAKDAKAKNRRSASTQWDAKDAPARAVSSKEVRENFVLWY